MAYYRVTLVFVRMRQAEGYLGSVRALKRGLYYGCILAYNEWNAGRYDGSAGRGDTSWRGQEVREGGIDMKIQNINGTSQTTCACGSWLKHWEKFSGQSVTYCPVSSPFCLDKGLVGAHVQKADSTDGKWYIYPLCSAHNQSTGVLEVSIAYELVSANKKETCEK